MKPINKHRFMFFLIVILPILSVSGGAYIGWKSYSSGKAEKARINRIVKIDALIDEVNNGRRKAINDLYDLLENNPEMPLDENDKIQQAFINFNKNWTEDFIQPISRRFIELETNSVKNWSIELLYYYLIAKNSYWNSLSNRKAVLNEIIIRKHKYFVGVLVDMANTTQEIDFAIQISRTICSLTNFAAYKTDDQFARPYEQRAIADLMRFKWLNEWWENEGSSVKEYSCPLDKLVTTSRSYHYYEFFDEDKEKEKEMELQKIKELKEIVENYPKLSRANAEYAYWMIDDKKLFPEVERLAKLAIKNGEEGLPWVILAFLNYTKGEKGKALINYEEAEKRVGNESLLRIVRHEKFLPMFYAYANYFIQEIPAK